ncbi:MAG: hypothetical protein CMI18_09880 [Opitutaceae bacterium]|nr:hypothetical protein [Opitutaceae bacterium]
MKRDIRFLKLLCAVNVRGKNIISKDDFDRHSKILDSRMFAPKFKMEISFFAGNQSAYPN